MTKNLSLGIELGSTRIKAVVVDNLGKLIESSSYSWKSNFTDGYWSYGLDEVDYGVKDVLKQLKTPLHEIDAVGVSAMMHGYLAFDRDDNLLVSFRTWQNSTTSQATKELSELFQFNIPERWSVAHLYQAILNKEEHVNNIAFMTTLAGYVHYKLTGEKILGIGDASGMFPIDSKTKTYNADFVNKFDLLLKDKSVSFKILDILPKVFLAGEFMTKSESFKTDFKIGHDKTIFCPPEGDAGTGMVATNTLKVKTGNISAGTSVFAMLVLDKPLQSYYSQIDVVTTPQGDEVAMIHANNCTLDLNAWVNLFAQVLEAYGVSVDISKLFGKLFELALKGEKDGAGIVNLPYLTGEQIINVNSDGLLGLLRDADAKFDLASFMRVQLMSCLVALKVGFDILKEKEGVEVQKLLGHGGFFNTKNVGQIIMSAATGCEVLVLETANEGGAWGMAVLAQFALYVKSDDSFSVGDLQKFLDQIIFRNLPISSQEASKADKEGFELYAKKMLEKLEIINTKGAKSD